jgi:hypothetical protein
MFALGCLIILSSAACAPKDIKPVELVTTRVVQVARPTPIVPPISSLDLRPVTWVVITENNYQKVFDNLEAKGQTPIIYGLTEEGYKNLNLNNNDVITVIREYKNVIAVYEKSYLETCC